jgi:membrane fusion protein, heavy metal efflux system
MKTYLMAVLSLAFLVGGCNRTSNETPQAEVRPEPSRAANSAEGAANLVQIRPEMMRDLRVQTAPVELRSGSEEAGLLGEIGVNENNYAEVGAPIASRLVEIHAAAGQLVTKGQDLATLQSVEIGRARAEYITAKARLDLARQTLERKLRLAAEKIVPQRDVQEAEAGVTSTEAEVRAALAALGTLGAGDEGSDSSQLILRSPIAGTIIERNAVQGQQVEPAQLLFKVSEMSRLWLTVNAFERDAVRVRVGSPARITFPALPGRTFRGTVALVGKQVNADSRTVAVRVEVANQSGLLLPGMSATAWIPVGGTGQRIISVPAAAVQRLDEQWFVFVPRTADTFEVRLVGRGRDLGGEVEIVSGLKTGEVVVVDGAFLLKAEVEKSRSEGQEHDH